jgi:CheY-like chemotaxis protein
MVVLPSMLITDDDRDFRETLQGVFQARGFRTLLAGDGQEALEIVATSQVHVVLIDFHMPRLDGLQAISRIHQIHTHLPCILISAGGDERLGEGEAFSVLAKPISYREVTRAVNDALRQTYNWEGIL